jgi:hypothetical protein
MSDSGNNLDATDLPPATYKFLFMTDVPTQHPSIATSQILLPDTHILPKLSMRNTADVTGGKPIHRRLSFVSP